MLVLQYSFIVYVFKIKTKNNHFNDYSYLLILKLSTQVAKIRVATGSKNVCLI